MEETEIIEGEVVEVQVRGNRIGRHVVCLVCLCGDRLFGLEFRVAWA
jgi:hypothetical protein